MRTPKNNATKSQRRHLASSMQNNTKQNETVSTASELLSVMQNSHAKTVGELLPVLNRAVGPTLSIGYNGDSGAQSSSALLILYAKNPNTAKSELAKFRGTVFSWDAASHARIVSRPPTALVENASIDRALKNPAEWTITEMADDTNVVLYNHNGWKMSSARGIDVSNHCWTGTELTFKNALEETLPEAFSWDKLDTECCYTVGFHHHTMHPFTAVPQHARLLQVVNLTTGKTLNCAETTKDEFDQIAAEIGIPADSPAKLPNFPPKQLKQWMLSNNNEALRNYVHAVHTGSTPVVHFGYILRKNGEDSVALSCPSSLMHIIKKTVYSFPPRCDVSPQNKQKYIVLRACLDARTKYDFLRLFPQWASLYRSYEDQIKTTAFIIVDELSKRCVGASEWSSDCNSSAHDLAKELIDYVVGGFDVNPMDSNATSIVCDIISDPANIDLMMKYMD